MSAIKLERISVVVAENHPLTLRGVISLLKEEPDIAVLAGVTSGGEAIDAIRQHNPNVAVLGMGLPDRGALDVLEGLANEAVSTRCVLLSTHLNEDDFLRAVGLGVRGVVLKDMPASLLVHCVRIVHEGGEFLEKELFRRAFVGMLRRSDAQREMARQLTERERAIVEHVVGGLSNKEVARRLGLSEGTVKSHLHRVYEKLRVRGRYNLIKLNRGQAPDWV